MISVEVKIYDKNKYKKDSKKVAEVVYKNIRGFSVVTGLEAYRIGLETDGHSRDEHNEYLIITLANGETATFCNSHVDMFRI